MVLVKGGYSFVAFITYDSKVEWDKFDYLF